MAYQEFPQVNTGYLAEQQVIAADFIPYANLTHSEKLAQSVLNATYPDGTFQAVRMALAVDSAVTFVTETSASGLAIASLEDICKDENGLTALMYAGLSKAAQQRNQGINARPLDGSEWTSTVLCGELEPQRVGDEAFVADTHRGVRVSRLSTKVLQALTTKKSDLRRLHHRPTILL